MLKVVVYFYLVFEVTSKSYEIHSHIKAPTTGMSRLSPQAFKRTAELIYLINKQLSEEKKHSDYNDEEKNAKVDLDYYNVGDDERKDSLVELMQLVQKNYDANLKYGLKDISNVRVHVISNPEVLEEYQKKLRGLSNLSITEDNSEYSDYAMKTKRNSERRKAAFRFDSLSKENKANFNQDDEKIVIERDNFEDSLKQHFSGKLSKLLTDDNLNKKVNKDKPKDLSADKKIDSNLNLKKSKPYHRLGDSLEEYKKEDAKDWQRDDENKSDGGSKEKFITKGLWQIDNSREEPKKEWVDYEKPKKTTKNDDYHYDTKDKKDNDKDEWRQTRKSKTDQWDKDTTKKDIDRSWEDKEKTVKVKNKDDDWSQVGVPKKWEENETTKKYIDFNRANKNKNKWSIEIADNSKTTKNSNSRSAKLINKSGDNSWEIEKKGKKRDNWKKDDWNKKDDSWDTWSEKKQVKKWEIKKKPERKDKANEWGYMPKKENKKRNQDNGRGGFGRTPIPFVGKKGIYED